MDKFVTYDGEQPIWLDDFNFMDKAVRDTFKRLVLSLSGNIGNAILYGCDVTDSAAGCSWTSGIVCIDGEILPIDAGQAGSGAVLYFSLQESFDPAGDRTFKNGAEHRCYSIRKALLSTTQSDIPYNGIGRLDSILKSRLSTDTYYSIEDEKGAGKAKIIKSSSGAFFLSLTLSAPVMGLSTDTLVNGAKILGLSFDDAAGIIGKSTPAIMTYISSSMTVGNIYPVIITISRSEDSASPLLTVKFTGSESLNFGTGYIYCRLIDNNILE